MVVIYMIICFFNDTATTEINTYGHTLSLHDALPISVQRSLRRATPARANPNGIRYALLLSPAAVRVAYCAALFVFSICHCRPVMASERAHRSRASAGSRAAAPSRDTAGAPKLSSSQRGPTRQIGRAHV